MVFLNVKWNKWHHVNIAYDKAIQTPLKLYVGCKKSLNICLLLNGCQWKWLALKKGVVPTSTSWVWFWKALSFYSLSFISAMFLFCLFFPVLFFFLLRGATWKTHTKLCECVYLCLLGWYMNAVVQIKTIPWLGYAWHKKKKKNVSENSFSLRN